MRGLRSKDKRLSLANWYKENNIDILYLQETYCSKEFKPKFEREWKHIAGKIKHCYTNSSHSRGISIIFRKDIELKIKNTFRITDI